MSITTSAVTVQEMSTGKGTANPHPDDVQFKVQYSKEFTGPKYMPEGEVTVMNKDLAADFEKRGMGFIVKNEAEANATDKEILATVAEGKKPYVKMTKAELHSELKARVIEFDETLKNTELVSLLEADDQKEKE